MNKTNEYLKVFKNCQECHLCDTRTKLVHYRGGEDPTIIFVGEAPGQSEDIIGHPFVGASGEKLNTMVDTAWKKVEDQTGKKFTAQFIQGYFGYMNVLGCLPVDETGNGRTPDQSEIDACRPRALMLMSCFRPQRVIALGEVADKALIDWKISHEHMYHPSFLLRQKTILHEEKWIMKLCRIIKENL